VIPLQKGQVFHFGGIKKAHSQQLQSALNSRVSNTIKHFYQQFEPAAIRKHPHRDVSLLLFKIFV
jgi:hypothetical protein